MKQKSIEELGDIINDAIRGIVAHILTQPDKLGSVPATEINAEMDASEDMIMTLLRILKHARSAAAAETKGGPAESIMDLLGGEHQV